MNPQVRTYVHLPNESVEISFDINSPKPGAEDTFDAQRNGTPITPTTDQQVGELPSFMIPIWSDGERPNGSDGEHQNGENEERQNGENGSEGNKLSLPVQPLNNAKQLRHTVTVMFIFGIISLTQIAILFSPWWTGSNATLSEVGKPDGIKKATSLIMFVLGIVSLISNVALTVLMGWRCICQDRRMPVFAGKILPFSILPWAVGVAIQAITALALGWELGRTDGFAIGLLLLLSIATRYANKLNKTPIQVAPCAFT